MKIAVYAGSFDPITLGHLDILKNGSEIFDKVLIAVARNPEKKGLLETEERVRLIKESTKDINNVEVFSFEGLTVDFAKEHNADFLIRGLRNSADFEYENDLAQINHKLNKDIQTVFLTAKPEHSFISSSAVRELLSHKCDLSDFVPKTAAEYLYKKFNY